jgi:hypothetical protein
MFYLLKNLLLLILVISKLKCNNQFFDEIMVLNALYVCLLHSRFVENQLIWILEDRPLISEAVLSHSGNGARSDSSSSVPTKLSQPLPHHKSHEG